MDIDRVLRDLAAAGALPIVLELGLIILVTLLALAFAQRGLDHMIRTLLEREKFEGTAQELSAIELQKRRGTLSGLGAGAVRAIILAIAFLMALRALRLDIGPAIAGLGIVGLAVGLGAQNLVRDYVAGTFILIENQFAKGDVVRVVDVTGTVEDLSLRRTTLRDLDGTVHSVPNGLIGVASNLTRVWARVNIEVTVKHGTDLEAATALVDRCGQEMAADPAWARRVLEPARVDRVSGLGAAGVTLQVLGSVRAADRWAASGEIRRRVATAFAEQAIELA